MKEQRNITLAGETISYTLERKAVKNINMRLRPETGLLVSAPMHVPSERVEQILQQHAAKILQTLHQYAAAAEKPKQYPVHYTAGEPVLYLGNPVGWRWNAAVGKACWCRGKRSGCW